MNPGTASAVPSRLVRAAPLLLAAAILIAYAPSLAGGFINYDDPWLIRQNKVLRRAEPAALATIWTDLGEEARMSLGAEYLPVRDTLQWVEARVHGLEPHPLRAASLLIYIAAVLLLRGALRRALRPEVAELAVWLFALHPVHAESVAWLAGRKDVLALLFVTWALNAYAGDSRHRPWQVPLLFALACLSKGVAVAAPLLLPIHDALTGRRPHSRSFWPSLAVGLGAMILHVKVGAVVGMATALPGGSRAAAVATMGPVWLRYLAGIAWPARLSVVYDVPVRAAGDLVGWASYLVLAGWAAAGIALFRRGHRLPLVALAWFLLPLAPTSQVLVPIEHLMADRYLLIAVLGPCALAAAAIFLLPSQRARWAIAGTILVSLAMASGVRSHVFADSIRLWRDATEKTTASVVAPYQLAESYKERGRTRDAEAAYREAVRRAGPAEENGRKAANNLAAILAGEGRLAEAEAVLRDAVARFPDDPRVLNNLAEVVARAGNEAAARTLFEELVRRFPYYVVGRQNYDRRYGDGRRETR